MMKQMKISCKFLFLFCALTLFAVGIIILINPFGKQTSELIIPKKEDILLSGYPKNAMGQTYGPDLGNLIAESPTLMLAKGNGGIMGYIYMIEGASSPEDTDEYMKKHNGSFSIPLYLQDGITVIGEFIVNS